MNNLTKFSHQVTQDPTQPAAQAMLHAIGLTEDDFQKPLVGIASTGYEGNPATCTSMDCRIKLKRNAC